MPKQNVLFVGLHRPGRSPSQRYRFEQYFDFLRAEGLNVELSYVINEEDDKIFYSKGNLLSKAGIFVKGYLKRKRELKRIDTFDAIYIQREALMTGHTFFEEAVNKSKAKFIFDFDDSIWLQNVSEANRRLQFLKKPQKTSKLIALADQVVAGNTYLAEYARTFNENTTIIPSTIDTDKFKRGRWNEGDSVIIGWSGSVTTIQHFERAIPVLKRIKERFGDGVSFRVVGDPNYRLSELDIQGTAWTEESEVAMLSTFDIGIMPLPDDQWTRGKCGLKGLAYMAMEVATIMSPVGVNSEIIQDGENGFLADDEDEWFEKISKLVEDSALRKRLGKAGRQTVVDHYSVHANKERYRQLFLS